MRLVRNSLLNQGVKLIGFVNRQKLIQVFSKTKKNIFLILFSSTFFVRRTKKWTKIQVMDFFSFILPDRT